MPLSAHQSPIYLTRCIFAGTKVWGIVNTKILVFRIFILDNSEFVNYNMDEVIIVSNQNSVGIRIRIARTAAKLKQDGYPVISGPRTTGDGYYESCILGFEGNVIEITV